MKKLKWQYVLILSLLCVLIMSCAANSKFQLTGEKFSPYKGEVQVFTNLPEHKTYQKIGTVKSQGVEAAKKKAAQYGANAIVITRQEKTEDSRVIIPNPTTSGVIIVGSYPHEKTEAIAIRFSDDELQ